MEKEFLPYNESLELKELGFDEPCIKGFYKKESIYSTVNAPVDFNNKKQSSELISAPTFSQAFRFFREKYNIECYIKSLYEQRKNKGFYFGIDDYNNRDFYSSPYYSYEQAELECLRKLIQIVKENRLQG